MTITVRLPVVTKLEWNVYPYRRGFTVLATNSRRGESLTNDGSNAIAYDGTRRDCFFVTKEEAQAGIDNYNKAT